MEFSVESLFLSLLFTLYHLYKSWSYQLFKKELFTTCISIRKYLLPSLLILQRNKIYITFTSHFYYLKEKGDQNHLKITRRNSII